MPCLATVRIYHVLYTCNPLTLGSLAIPLESSLLRPKTLPLGSLLLNSGKSFTLLPMPARTARIELRDHRYKSFAKAYMGKALRNATQAAILAGYSPRTAKVQGCNLLTDPNVRRLMRLEAERSARKMDIGPEFVIAELGKIAKANMLDYVDDTGKFVGMDVLSRDAGAAISEFTVDEERRTDGRSSAKRKRKTETASTITRTRFKLASKTTALELLGKHFNLLGLSDNGSQMAVKVIVMNSPRPAFDALQEAKRIAALPDVDPGESPVDVEEWDGRGGPDVLPDGATQLGDDARDAAADDPGPRGGPAKR